MRWASLSAATLLIAGAGGAWAVRDQGSASANELQSSSAANPVYHQNRVLLTVSEKRAAQATGQWPSGIKSLLRVDRKLRYGQFVWNEDGVAQGPITVRVDLRTQLISVFRAGHEVGTAVILFGADSHMTPSGTFPILAKARDHRSRSYNAPMPYTLWLTSDGVAIHGSDVERGAATHGCVGVPLEFARRLFEQAKAGDKVLIVGQSSRTGSAGHREDVNLLVT